MGKNKEEKKKSMATTSHDEENKLEHSSSSSPSIEDSDKKLTDSIFEKLSGSSTPKSNQLSIYRVHKKFRKIDKFAYRPEMVSIGPFHHEERSLPKMDEHKLRYANDFFSRTISPTTSINEYVKSLRGMLDEARKCYSENFFGDQDSDNNDDDQPDANANKKNKKKKNKKQKPKLNDDDKFVEMMLIDGLFIIELFRKSHAQKKRRESDTTSSRYSQEEEKKDLVFSNIWRKQSLIRDMILLGNQLPMFVLEYLFTMSTTTTTTTTNVNDTSPSCSLTKLALHFFDPLMPRSEEVLDKYSECKGMHLLDLFKKTFQVQLAEVPLDEVQLDIERYKTINQSKFIIPSVTELRVAGVRFEVSKSDSFLGIEFDKGVLKIPRVDIHEQMDSLMSNFIAAEQCYDGGANNYLYMTSYAFLMNSLLTSPKDVEYLRGRKIIVRSLNKDEDVSNLFTKLCTEVTLTNFYYSELCVKVNDYYDTHWKFWRASWLETAKREFFNNPWIIFAFFATVLVICLTLLQTIFAILSYYSQERYTEALPNPKP